LLDQPASTRRLRRRADLRAADPRGRHRIRSQHPRQPVPQEQGRPAEIADPLCRLLVGTSAGSAAACSGF